MASSSSALAHRLLSIWARVRGLPFGGRIFGILLGRMVPYSATIKPTLLELEPGHAVLTFPDRRRVRNHLRSIHAVALANAGELAGGLAMSTGLPAEYRAIVTDLRVEYTKKARGTLRAVGRAALPAGLTEPTPFDVVTEIFDLEGDMVARVTVQWLVDLRP